MYLLAPKLSNTLRIGYVQPRPSANPPIRNEEERKKVIISGSLGTAVRRSMIHIFPLLTSITILAINLHGIYVGIDFPGPLRSDTIDTMFLQLAAKANELMIVASLSLMILHAVRYELLYGDGLPLGLIGSGFSFSNVGLFFTKEFWSSLRYLTYSRTNRVRKIGFVTLLIVAGLAAVLSGPASAVLLVPKSQEYPLGGTDFYLNGSESQFWPSDTANLLSDSLQYCNSDNSFQIGICPAGGFFSLWEQWDALSYPLLNTKQQSAPPFAKDIAGSRFYSSTRSHHSQIPPLYALGDARIEGDNTLFPYTWLVQAHAASSSILQRIATDWWAQVPSKMGVSERRIDDRNIKATLPGVISAVRCADPQNISVADQAVHFPTIEGRWDWAKSSNLKINDLNKTIVDHLRFRWVRLPEEFGPASIGSIFESPWDNSSRSRVVIGCTAQTGWIPTDHFTDSYTFWSGWYPWNLKFGDRTPAWSVPANGKPLDPTNGRIALADEWLKLLTPPSPVSFHGLRWQASTIESILENAGLGENTLPWIGTTLTEDWINSGSSPHGQKLRILEAVLCSVLADGLSRSGSSRVFNITSESASDWSLRLYNPVPDFHQRIFKGESAFRKPNLPPEDYVTLHARMLITGLAFRATLAGFLAMAVLVTHAIMALTFASWIILHKRTSRSWDSIAGMIALIHNSHPTSALLKNAGAGIECGKTFAQVAKIRVIRPSSAGSDIDEHVELVFEENTSTGIDQEMHSSLRPASSTSPGGRPASHASAMSGSWTFPLDARRPGMVVDSELDDRSSGTERLIPEVRLPDGERDGLVRVNQAYG